MNKPKKTSLIHEHDIFVLKFIKYIHHKIFFKKVKVSILWKRHTLQESKVPYFRVGTNLFLLVKTFNVIHKNGIFDSMLLDIPERPQWTYHFLPKCTNWSDLIVISIHVSVFKRWPRGVYEKLAGRWKAKQWSSLPFNNSLTLIFLNPSNIYIVYICQVLLHVQVLSCL